MGRCQRGGLLSIMRPEAVAALSPERREELDAALLCHACRTGSTEPCVTEHGVGIWWLGAPDGREVVEFERAGRA